MIYFIRIQLTNIILEKKLMILLLFCEKSLLIDI